MHEKIIKRDDGSKVQIIVSILEDQGGLVYRERVKVCSKGKRTWVSPFDNGGHDYRKMSVAEQKAFSREQLLKFVSKEELMQAKLELWEKFKPQEL
jgi:hypothetical protein